ncbi:MAG: trypsin-like peptidase domain-containing protein, partial [Oscillospiraceae bacterium]|nr:trypsin-like peptidase domain-containing protein [Oscillospiraceae bacterium]
MDEFEKNEMNENPAEEVFEEPKVQENAERNTDAPSGWTYSANTNQYVSWDGNGDPNSAQWNPGYQQRTEQQPPRREYGTQYGYYGTRPQTNYYSNNGGSYQWDFNKYESVEQNRAQSEKKSSGKGLKVFLGIIAAIVGICVISLSSVGIYKMISGENGIASFEPDPEGGIGLIGEEEKGEVPEITLQDIPKDNTVSTDGKLSATEIYKMASPSVVGIVQYQYSYSFEPAGSGSGIILSEDGYIVTNAHVIDGAETVKVVLYNEEEYEAAVIGSDKQTDIAVLKIDANHLVEAEFGDSSQVEIGEIVYALGNPGGLELQSSFTDGIVSGLNRVITTDDSIYSMTVLQTSAAI